MNIPDRIVSTNENGQQKGKQFINNSSLINKADEFFQKRVPLVDIMNSIKEVKETIPTIQKLELKIAIQEDKLTDMMVLLNEKAQQNHDIEAMMKIFSDDNERKLKEIIKLQEERLREYLNKKADLEEVMEVIGLKASKADYGDLYKKYSQLYVTLEPLIINSDNLKSLCNKMTEADNIPDVQQQLFDMNKAIQRFESSLESRNAMLEQFKDMKKEMKTLTKQVALLYDEHIYSIDVDDSEEEREKRRRRTQKLQDIKKIAFAESPVMFMSESSDSEMEDKIVEPQGMRPPNEDDLRDNPKLFQNLHGFSDLYFEKQKVLEDYKTEKVLRYLQCQINDIHRKNSRNENTINI